ncbi:MAG: DsbA family protein [Solirubrobacterales bacterium]|nr:DsbA family protein [Solirubrobacterales bacterium]
MLATDPEPPSAFYFDLASPLAYLAAERALQLIPGVRWVPVLARELPAPESFEAFRCATEERIFRSEIERRTHQLGLQPLVWPARFPFDSARAMLAATYAMSIGRTVAFTLAAFRQAFAGGHPLDDEQFVLIAAAACEMHPDAVLRALTTRSIGEQLAAHTARAAREGALDVPAVTIAGRTFVGERALEQAAAHAAAAHGAAHAGAAHAASTASGAALAR